MNNVHPHRQSLDAGRDPLPSKRSAEGNGSHMQGSGGALAPPGRVKGRQPLPPEASSQAFRAGISRMGQPLAAGG